MQPYMIETVDITKRFPGTLANDHICLRARAGEIMGLVGENGAGKSTILKCLNGVYPSDSYEGKILIEGKEVRRLTRSALGSALSRRRSTFCRI